MIENIWDKAGKTIKDLLDNIDDTIGDTIDKIGDTLDKIGNNNGRWLNSASISVKY